jgi:hypothetical protein
MKRTPVNGRTAGNMAKVPMFTVVEAGTSVSGRTASRMAKALSRMPEAIASTGVSGRTANSGTARTMIVVAAMSCRSILMASIGNLNEVVGGETSAENEQKTVKVRQTKVS